MSNSLSFCILNESTPSYGPVQVIIPSLLETDVSEGLSAILRKYQESPDNLWSYIFTTANKPPIDLITDHLCQWRHYVYYHWDSPYVVAFSINYTRFELLGGHMIHWRENDEYDPIAVRGHLSVPRPSGPQGPPSLSPVDV